MHDGVRRLSILLIVGCLALFATYWFRGRTPVYNLFNLLRGEKALLTPQAQPLAPNTPTPNGPAEDRTAPAQPQAGLSEVKHSPVLMARLSEERANLADLVLESAVSVSGERRASALKARYRRSNHGGYLVPDQVARARQGSGVIVRKEGYVVTNHHVIDGVDNIVVTTRGGVQYTATLIGSDRVVDVAVLKIDVEPDQQFAALAFGDSDRIRDGEMVFSVGSPFGLDGTITDGVISSARPRRSSDSGPPLIQTNTVLNKGNSGGPLVNVYGNIIGINRAIYSGPKEKEHGQSYGFAIPANAVRTAVEKIFNQAVPTYGYLGVYVADVALVDAFGLGLDGTQGCLVTGALAGSPAHRAGLQRNDVIVGYNERKVHTAQDLLNLIQNTPIGTKVALQVWREREKEVITATILDQGSVAVPEPLETEVIRVWSIAGVAVRYLTSSVRRRRGYEPSFPMVEVMDVRPDSPASRVGLQPGFLVHYVDDDPSDTHAAFYNMLASTSKPLVTLTVSTPSEDGSRGFMGPLQLPLDRL